MDHTIDEGFEVQQSPRPVRSLHEVLSTRSTQLQNSTANSLSNSITNNENCQYNNDEKELENSSVVLYGLETDLNQIFERISATVSDDEFQRYKQTVHKMEIDRESIMHQLQLLEEQCDTYLNDYKDKVEECGELSQIINQLRQELLEVRSMHDSSKDEKNTLEISLHECDQLNSSLRDELASAKLEIGKLRMETGMLRSERDGLKLEVQNAMEQLKDVQHQLSRSKDSRDHELSTIQEDKSKAEALISTLQGEISERIQAYSRLGTEMVSMERTVARLREDLAITQQRVVRADALERELDHATWRVSTLEAECRELTAQNTLLRSSSSSQPGTLSSGLSGAYAGRRDAHPPAVEFRSTHSEHNGSSDRFGRALSGESYDAYLGSGSSRHVAATRSDYSPREEESTAFRANVPGKQTLSDAARQPRPPPVVVPSSLHRHEEVAKEPVGGMDPFASDSGNRRRSTGSTPGGGSLASVLSGKKSAAVAERMFNSQAGHGGRGGVLPDSQAPFATEYASAALDSQFSSLDRELTGLMAEKAALMDESERLQQRGLKVLRDRTRLQQVEARLGELSRDIGSVRRRLTAKPN